MTITAAGLAGGDFLNNSAGPITFSLGSVTAGQMIWVAAGKYSPSADAFAAGDCTKNAGTATIGAITLDNSAGGSTGGAAYSYTGQWSCLVTGTGTLTMQVSSGASGSYWLIAAEAFNGSWDANRVEHAPTGVLNTDDLLASLGTGNGTSAGAALFCGGISINTNETTTLTADGAFTVAYEHEAGTSDGVGSFAYRIVSTGTTDEGAWSWTPVLNGGANGEGASACLVVYKESSSQSNAPRAMHHLQMMRG